MTMDKIIVTVLLIIAGLTAAFAVFNSVYPAVQRSSQSMSDAANDISDRITSRIEIIQVGSANTSVDAWVKNVGSSRILGIDHSDIFFGVIGNFSRISYGDDESPLPYWSYQLEGDYTTWEQTATNAITIHLPESLSPGVYLFKMVLPNGNFDETSFSLE
jgi:archaellum component FlaF (FlaF/FlaG flagellin family)